MVPVRLPSPKPAPVALRVMRAVIPVRQSICATGFGEVVSECDGRVVLIGDGCNEAAAQLQGIAHEITIIEAGDFAPAAWARFLTPQLSDDDIIVLPTSPDGRDLPLDSLMNLVSISMPALFEFHHTLWILPGGVDN